MDIIDNYFKSNRYIEYLDEFDKEVESNSDRGITSACGSILDNMLKELLQLFLIENNKVEKEMFSVSGPLGTFDDRVKMCYYLGLISSDLKKQIVLIQRVRNKFAHLVGKDLSFEHGEIKDICSNFNIPKNSFVPPYVPFMKSGEKDLPTVNLNPIRKDTPSKEKFILAFKFVYSQFANKFLLGIDRRIPETKIPTAVEFAENQIKIVDKMLQERSEIIRELEEIVDSNYKQIEKLKVSEELSEESLNKAEEKLEEGKKLLERQKDDYDEISSFFVPIRKINDYTLAVFKNSLE